MMKETNKKTLLLINKTHNKSKVYEVGIKWDKWGQSTVFANIRNNCVPTPLITS